MSTLLSKKLWGLMLLVVAEVKKIEGPVPPVPNGGCAYVVHKHVSCL